MPIDQFLNELAKHTSSSSVTNPYEARHAVNNLRIYLEYVLAQEGKRVLLVGEAPGYRGCAITGIPFTSGNVFSRFNHPLLRALKGGITLPRIESESTATMVWNYLSTKRCAPLLWNSFPFHPHRDGHPLCNRPPTDAEVLIGVTFLKQLVGLYQPSVVAAIGARALRGLKLAFPGREFACIRHPSNGGKREFIRGMDSVI